MKVLLGLKYFLQCLVTNLRLIYPKQLPHPVLLNACIVDGFLFAAKNTSHHLQCNQSFLLLSRFSLRYGS